MTDINQTHNGTGDNVAGDKTGGTFSTKESSSMPLWTQWVGWFVGILVLAWAVYIYIFPHY